MTTLSIDIETYSSVNLLDSGVYPYVEAEDFEILLFAYSFDDDPVTCIDLTFDGELPEQILNALTDPSIIKTAYNANFERTCIAKHFGIDTDPSQWHCTQVHSLMLGLPGNLENVAKSLKLDAQKDSAGKALIRYFSVPCRPTKTNGGRTRNLPEHDPDRWNDFIEYCRQDVVVEQEIREKLLKHPIPTFEHRLWQLDQEIVSRGVRVDTELVSSAINFDQSYTKRLRAEAKELTGLDNPNSVTQLKDWLTEMTGSKVTSLTKETVPELIAQAKDDSVKRVLELRQEMSKTSVKKYQAMNVVKCSDDRIRGLLQFYGANRTGRWAGRLVQVQNLPRNYLKDLGLARQLLIDGDYEMLELLFDSVPDVLSQLIRTALVPSEGSRFIVSDFSAIEARVVAWLAREQWVVDVFNGHGKIYEATAASMYGVPIESIDRGSELREKGKVAVLACGYAGGVGALISMGALRSGLAEDELQGIVDAWRAANPNIVKLWYAVERAALTAVREKRKVKLDKLEFSFESGMLFIKLPSGRRLAYVRPQIRPGKFGKDALSYEAYESGQWGRTETFGGKLVENIVQAIARDCLAEALLRVDAAGYKTVFHVHDEIVCDMPVGEGSVEELSEIMSQPIDWAPGLPLAADGFECDYYMKD